MLSFHEEYESEDGLGNTRNKQMLNQDDKTINKFNDNSKNNCLKVADSCDEDGDSDKTRGKIFI